MNSCILTAKIIQEPQLRYTADNQMPVAEMLVEFSSGRPNDPPSHLKVVGWGNTAQDIGQNYHVGDCVIIEGRLGMNLIERSEGFKEKRAELVATRIYTINSLMSDSTETPTNANYAPSSAPSNVVPLGSRHRTNPNPSNSGLENELPATPSPVTPNPEPSGSDTPGDDDPIPF